jgi:hypothetical protein
MALATDLSATDSLPEDHRRRVAKKQRHQNPVISQTGGEVVDERMLYRRGR